MFISSVEDRLFCLKHFQTADWIFKGEAAFFLSVIKVNVDKYFIREKQGPQSFIPCSYPQNENYIQVRDTNNDKSIYTDQLTLNIQTNKYSNCLLLPSY